MDLRQWLFRTQALLGRLLGDNPEYKLETFVGQARARQGLYVVQLQVGKYWAVAEYSRPYSFWTDRRGHR